MGRGPASSSAEETWRDCGVLEGIPRQALIACNTLLHEELQIKRNANVLCHLYLELLSVQFSSVAQLCPILCDPMDCSTPGFPVHHQLPELAQTHVHRVGDAIQPSHPVVPFSFCLQSFLASGSFPMSQFFASGGQSIGISVSVLPMNSQD